MIYLVTVHDRKKKIADIDSDQQIQSHFWESFLKLTEHKTVLYGPETFNAMNSTPLPNRVNIIFTLKTRRLKHNKNALIHNNYKEIINTFANKEEDIYVLGSSRRLIERFAKDVDYIIDYTSDEVGHSTQSIFDSINFADYTLLKIQEYEFFVLRYFVREKTNFIGY